jgi:hypothetical protein
MLSNLNGSELRLLNVVPSALTVIERIEGVGGEVGNA